MLEENVMVTVTKNTSLKHGSSCSQSTQQKIVHRSRGGDCITELRMLSSFQLHNTIQTAGKLKLSMTKDSLEK